MPMDKDTVMPTNPSEERRRPSSGGNSGFGQVMRKAKADVRETTGLCTPTMPADEMRQASQHSDGIGQMAKGMAGSTRSEQMRPSQPLPPEKRQRGDRPG